MAIETTAGSESRMSTPAFVELPNPAARITTPKPALDASSRRRADVGSPIRRKSGTDHRETSHMVYPEGTWVVDTMTGDLGQVVRQTGVLLSLQRSGHGGLWSADPGTVRPATAREVHESRALATVEEEVRL